MKPKRLAFAALLVAGSSFAFVPSFAQSPPHQGHPPPHGNNRGGNHGRPHFTFAHHDFAHFSVGERNAWIGGRWSHSWHNGRFGWWWLAGGAWYFYAAPVYPYPGYVSDVYADEDDYGPGYNQFWYYCANPPGYYPYVQHCNWPWRPVPAAAPSDNGEYGPGYGPAQGPGGPPGYQGPPNGPGPGDQPPPGYQGPDNGQGPGDQPPPGYQDQGQGDQDQGQGDQPPPGYQGPPPGYQGPPPGYQGPPPGYQGPPPPPPQDGGNGPN